MVSRDSSVNQEIPRLGLTPCRNYRIMSRSCNRTDESAVSPKREHPVAAMDRLQDLDITRTSTPSDYEGTPCERICRHDCRIWICCTKYRLARPGPFDLSTHQDLRSAACGLCLRRHVVRPGGRLSRRRPRHRLPDRWTDEYLWRAEDTQHSPESALIQSPNGAC